MLGTSIDLTTARILHHSQRDDVNFEYIKLKAIKADFLQTIKRVGSFDLYKSYKAKLEAIDTKEKLISEIKNLGQHFAEKGVDTKKIDLYKAYAERSLNATQESCVKTYQHLKSDFDLITTKNECRMPAIVKKFDDNGNSLPLFKTNNQGTIETLVDEQGKERYLLNADVLDFTDCNKFFKFARLNGFKVHVNSILWHENVPEQIEQLAKSDLPPEIKKKMTEDFLYCYMKSYAQNAKENGVELESIDVLNEVANDDENTRDFLRQSVWRDLIGNDYCVEVLKIAKQAFPESELMYNDYNEFFPEKRANMIKVIQSIQAAERTEGIQLLDSVGLQCHLYGNDSLDYDTGFKELIDATKQGPFQQKVRVTEIDSAPCGNPDWQQAQMQQVIQAAEDNGIEKIGCWDSAEQFTDSFVEADNSSMIDKNGNETDLCQHLTEKHTEKENSSQQEQGASLSM